MTFLQALSYFAVEAARSLTRAWRASTIAILTIALSIYVGSFVLLITGNLTRATSTWQEDLRVTVYLEPDIDAAARGELIAAMAAPAWTAQVEEISREQARQRFASSFPRLVDVVEEGDFDFPESLEATLVADALPPDLSAWKRSLTEMPGVESVDDDREWISSLSRLMSATRSLGLVVGFGLLIAAAFTIASVVRLTAYLYVDEIMVLRHVGATEFFIRGPFYMAGLFQGLAGGLLALLVLSLTRWWIASRAADTFWQPLLLGEFLSPVALSGLVVLAGIAGFAGAFLSLRRERLEAPNTT